jgi:PAS domain S-box-containing protein
LFAFEWDPVTDHVRREGEAPSILGLDFQEETGASFFARIHPDDREQFERILRSLRPGSDAYTTVYRVLRPGGGETALEESGRAFVDEQGRFVRLIGMTADITQRHRAQQALAEQQQRLALAMEAGQLVPWEIDLLTGEVKDSARLLQLFGLDGRRDFQFRDQWRALVHEDDRLAIAASVEATKCGKEHHIEYRIHHPDGSIHWHETHGVPMADRQGRYVRLVGFARAISDGAFNAYISTVAVLPEYQKRSIGRELIRRLLDGRGHLQFVLHANDSAYPFYLHLDVGFEPFDQVLARRREF